MDTDDTASNRCPVTGLPLRQLDEWTDVELDEGYRATLFILGDNILVGRPSGFATMEGIKKVLDLSENIISSHLAPDEPYIHIQDYTHLNGSSLRARKYFSDQMKKRTRTGAVVFCGGSPFIRIAVQLAKRLHGFSFDMIIAKNYPEAARLAHSLSRGGGRTPQEETTETRGGRTVTMPSWELTLGEFTVRFEVIDGCIIHAVPRGVLEAEHLAPLASLREEVIDTLDRNVPLYYVAGVGALQGTDRKVRRLYQNSILELHGKREIRTFFIYGAGNIIRAAVSLARPFMEMKIRIVDDLYEALARIGEDRGDTAEPSTPPEKKERAGADHGKDVTRQHVDEMLAYLGGMNWDEEGFGLQPPVNPDHPLAPVFEAVDLIKKDLDDLFRTHRRSEEKLQKAHDDLWNRVAERTAELSTANARLLEQDKVRNRFIAEFGRSLLPSLKDVRSGTAGLLQEREGGITPGQRTRLTDIEEVVVRLQRLIGNVVEASMVESGEIVTESREFDLSLVFRSVEGLFQGACEKKGLSFSVQALDPFPMKGDRRRIEHLVVSLVESAVMTAAGGSVEVRAESDGDWAVIRVRTTGAFPGEPHPDRPFQAFGLHYPRTLAPLLGARLSVQGLSDGGSEIALSIPLR